MTHEIRIFFDQDCDVLSYMYHIAVARKRMKEEDKKSNRNKLEIYIDEQ